MENKNQWKGWLYLAPALILLAIFTFYPFVKTIIISFLGSYDEFGALKGYNPTSAYGWSFTLNNFYYARVEQIFVDGKWVEDIVKTGALGQDGFLLALKNTAVIAVVTVPGSTIIALLMAVALNSIKPLQKFLQTIYFLPYVTNSIAIGMVFAVMFDMNTQGVRYDGLINNFLSIFGLPAREWVEIGAPWENKIAVACIYAWKLLTM